MISGLCFILSLVRPLLWFSGPKYSGVRLLDDRCLYTNDAKFGPYDLREDAFNFIGPQITYWVEQKSGIKFWNLIKGVTAKYGQQQVYSIINRMGINFYTGLFLVRTQSLVHRALVTFQNVRENGKYRDELSFRTGSISVILLRNQEFWIRFWYVGWFVK